LVQKYKKVLLVIKTNKIPFFALIIMVLLVFIRPVQARNNPVQPMHLIRVIIIELQNPR